jgi:hypothetical protein
MPFEEVVSRTRARRIGVVARRERSAWHALLESLRTN